MSLKQSFAVRTLNDKLEQFFRKCLFSVINALAPVHSTYAAIKASAGFRPKDSYFAPNSNGTTKSSSIAVIFTMKPMNSLNSSGVKCLRTSSTISLGILMGCKGKVTIIVSKSVLEEGFLRIPKENIYSLESRTSSKFLFPEFFSCFTQGFYNLIFCHIRKGMFPLRDEFSHFFEMLLCLLRIGFCHSYHLKKYNIEIVLNQRVALGYYEIRKG